MQTKDANDLVFHNENALLQIASWSKFISWAMAAIYTLRFISDLMSVFGGGQFTWPPAMMDRILFMTSLLSTLFFGAFYFLLLQGLAQGLYLALDGYLRGETETEEAG